MLAARRRNLQILSLSTIHRHLSHSSSSSSLHTKYTFTPPLSLSPNPNTPQKPSKSKPRYKPPSSFNHTAKPPFHSSLPFDFRFSYTETNPAVRPIGLREPKYSPFGPGVVDRNWTGVCAPVESLKVLDVEKGRVDEGDLEERRRVMRERVLGERLTGAERKAVVERCMRHRTKRQVNLGRDGLTHNMLNDIHNHWKHAEGVRIKCMGVPTVDMKNVCDQLEDKTFGKIIHRHGGLLVLYRGRFYNPKRRPVIPLMLWKPREPIYPRLIKTTIDGFSIEETKEMRKKGLAVPALTKLAKNGYYGSLVPMVRDAFLANEFVRIDCRGLEKSDYSKIGCKLRDLVPCVLVTFDKEQVVVWRGKNYKPIEDGYWLADRDPFDNSDNDLSSASEEQDSTDDGHIIHNFYSGDELSDLEV